MNLQWAKNFTGDVLVVHYDDLVENVGGTLKSILEFINFPINQVNSKAVKRNIPLFFSFSATAFAFYLC